jgi:RimJ/RimL family protein N-acetyltransferase
MIAWLRKQPVVVRTWSTRRLHLFGLGRDEGARLTSELPFRRNHWPDLVLFDPTERWLSREAFIALAQARLEGGEDVYTLVEDGRLIAYGWLKRDNRSSHYGYVDQTVTFAPGSAVIYNGFVHPAARGRRLHQECQRFRIGDLFADPAARYVYSAVEEPNRAALVSAERAGLRRQAVLETRMRFGRARKTAERLPGAFPIGFESDGVTAAAPAPHGLHGASA